MDYTKSGTRLIQVRAGEGLNWLFLPGGPGLGSESLLPLLTQLDLQGTIWRIDLPSDGSNLQNTIINLTNWQKALLEVVYSKQILNKVVLVGHSFGGMLIQTIPDLAQHLSGVVLMTTAPDNAWYVSFGERAKKRNLPNVSLFREKLLEHPCNEHYAEYLLQSLPYYFLDEFIIQGRQLFLTLPFNYKPYFWAVEKFHPNYQASWVPEIPCLILSSEFDVMTPANLYQKATYNAKNFIHATIDKAAHFPWVENFPAVQSCFKAFELVLNRGI